MRRAAQRSSPPLASSCCSSARASPATACGRAATPGVGGRRRARVPSRRAHAAPAAGPSGPPSFVRPTPTPLPTFLAYVVKARRHAHVDRPAVSDDRAEHRVLEPDPASVAGPRFAEYQPNRIEVGWVLLLVPDLELDPEDLPRETTPSASPIPAGPSPSTSALGP